MAVVAGVLVGDGECSMIFDAIGCPHTETRLTRERHFGGQNEKPRLAHPSFLWEFSRCLKAIVCPRGRQSFWSTFWRANIHKPSHTSHRWFPLS